MAPEQATGSSLDQRCDLYAVGVILYQMATGHLPFDGQNSMEVLTKHVNEPPIPPRKRQPDAPISEAMESLILRALEKDPALRPQTAEEFRHLLVAVAKKKPILEITADPLITPSHNTIPTGGPTTLPAPAVGRPKRRTGLFAGLGAVAAVVAIGGIALRSSVAPPVGPRKLARKEPASATPVPVQPSRDPQKAKELVQRASEWQAANDTGAARDLLEQAIALDPDNAEAHYRLGGLYLNSKPDRARSEYEAARRLNAPKYADVVDTILKGL
jgi:serine/threonine protein kinase